MICTHLYAETAVRLRRYVPVYSYPSRLSTGKARKQPMGPSQALIVRHTFRHSKLLIYMPWHRCKHVGMFSLDSIA